MRRMDIKIKNHILQTIKLCYDYNDFSKVSGKKYTPSLSSTVFFITTISPDPHMPRVVLSGVERFVHLWNRIDYESIHGSLPIISDPEVSIEQPTCNKRMCPIHQSYVMTPFTSRTSKQTHLLRSKA